MTKRIEKGDIVSLVFSNPTPEVDAEVNASTMADTSAEKEITLPEIPECYRDLVDVFSGKEAEILPPHRGHVDHHIQLEEGAKPVFGPMYNVSELELKVLKEYIEKNLKKGLYSPVHVSVRISGTIRQETRWQFGPLCRLQNAKLDDDREPAPYCFNDGIMDRIKLDVLDAFHRLRIAKGDDWKTVFRTRYGHFEYLVWCRKRSPWYPLSLPLKSRL